jgi:N6-L-threonylcarbamoyladenine synthase
MLHSGDLDFSFSGLKTAVLLKVRELTTPSDQQRADIARGFQDALVEVLVSKALRAVKMSGLIAAGGRRRRRRQPGTASPARSARRAVPAIAVFYPELEFCTDNGGDDRAGRSPAFTER